MKNLLVSALVLAFGLSACDSGSETPQPAAEAPQQALEAAPDEAADKAAATDEESPPELVEESAAEPEATQDGDAPLMLAQADDGNAGHDWQFTEGKQFTRLVPTQPTVGGGDKVEVAEFFWYGCGHCYDFEPYINRWAGDKPANARFVRVPATWNPLVKMHAKLYYTEDVLAKNGKLENRDQFHADVFNEYHRRSNRLTSENAIQALFEQHGVSADDFEKTWNSFEVAQKLRVAEDLARRY
ncbi:MAG TPA: thiol:disulfide interchange protein DsbA/DsbL, partial [Woeseiaceae bacterium]|nr:thiol:disulfide interchange protein DsbA/DsbL [Woeseiaceae bacterium]